MWRCQSTEAAKPRQHIGYISPNRTQATKVTPSDPYNEGYESILHVFDLQHLAATVHATLRLPDLPRANLRPKQRQNARTDRPCDFLTFPDVVEPPGPLTDTGYSR